MLSGPQLDQVAVRQRVAMQAGSVIDGNFTFTGDVSAMARWSLTVVALNSMAILGVLPRVFCNQRLFERNRRFVF